MRVSEYEENAVDAHPQQADVRQKQEPKPTVAFLELSPFFSTELLSVEPTADVRDRILVEASVKVAGDVADMRRCQQVRQRAERMIDRQRLLVEDIDGCARDRLISKRRNEICLDHDRSARHVYQARRRLHEC